MKNNCLPINVYSIEGQHLFLGCSVMSATASAGLNEQVGELTVQLVQDSCVSTKIYWDENLERQTADIADPGFLGESGAIIGAPVYFRVANFEFSGIVQSWEKNNSESANPSYTVKIIDPRQILECAQVIIGDYSGPVGNTNNLFNVFGALETLGEVCPKYFANGNSADGPVDPTFYKPGDGRPDGAIFGSHAGYYGGADVNANGMQWNQILLGLNFLVNSFGVIPSVLSGFGGPQLRFRGFTGTTAGYGLMPNDVSNQAYYYLDISELPAAPSYYRINGTNISIMELINTITQDAGYDYYIELIPVKNNQLSGNGVAKFIKIRTISRAAQPALGKIQDFIDDAEGFMNSNVGRELRPETTNAFIIGGNKETLYQAEQNEEPGFLNKNCMVADTADDDMIVPFFGLDLNDNAIRPIKNVDDDTWEFEVSTIDIQRQLKQLAFSEQTVTINEKELRFALGGYDAWLSYSTSADTKTDIALAAFPPEMLAVFNLNHLVELLKDVDAAKKIQPNDLVNTVKNALLFPNLDNDINNQKLEDLRTIYDWVNTFANEYYGKQFMVRIPFTCVKQDAENAQIITSEEPSRSGWTEQPTVLRLPNGTPLVTFFTEEDGKVGAFVRFNNTDGKESPNLRPEDYGTYDHDGDSVYDLYVRADVSEELVYYNKAIFCNPRVVIQLQEAVTEKDDTTNIAIKGLPELLAAILKAQGAAQAVIDQVLASVKGIMKNSGGKEIMFPIQTKAFLPDAACFGMRSNILTYGPWYNPGPPGKVLVERDTGLVPWEYNGYTALNTAGQYRADLAVNNMQVGEMGSIQVAGYPTLPLGAEIGAIAGGFFGAGTNLIENRSASLNQFVGGDNPLFVQYGGFTYGGSWTGIYGPNVTNISVQVAPEGITTTYNFRSFTAQFGRFSKANAERIKQIGQQRIKAVRELNLAQLRRRTNLVSFGRQLDAKERVRERGDGKHFQNNSPHSLMLGYVHPGFSGENLRTCVVTQEMSEIARDMSDETWPNTAVMSWDGLIRPIQIGNVGTGILGTFAPQSHNAGNMKNASRAMYPPVFKNSSSVEISITGAENNLEITSRHLNPFFIPGALKHVDATGDCGHDINVIARSSNSPLPSVSIPISETLTGTGYTEDCRPFVLRGPLMIQGWGYNTENKPVPNHTGYNGNTGVSDKFAPNWLQRPDTWPIGPLDVRWDERRGVWTTPPSHKLVRIKLTTEVPPLSTGVGVLVDMNGANIGHLNDATGAAISTPTVLVYDGLGIGGHASGFIWGYWDTWEEKYLLLNGALRILNSGCQETGNHSFVRNDIIFGTGVKAAYVDDGGNIYDSLAINDYSRIAILSNIKIGNYGGCLLNSTGNIFDSVNTLSSRQRFENLDFAGGLVAVANTGQSDCDIVVGLDVTITGNSPGTGGMPTGQFLGDTLVLDNGLTIDIDTVSNCWNPKIGLLHGDKTGSIPIITGVYCSGSSLVVQTGELVWQYGQISGVRDYTP